MNKAEVYARHKNARVSPQKARLVAGLIRGMDLKEAKLTLSFHNSKSAKMLLKVLKSAEANAVNNSGLNPANLYVQDAQVSKGTVMKRYRIVARSRINPILKKSSHLVIGLSRKMQE